ncbi:MAG TPA: FixH family protein [Terriglobales bacterium]|nr:FixH family protein [Terriglobales bacterium]
MNQTIKSPNPWPIAIIAFFVIAITGIVAFVVFATRNKMELVRHDYYDEEIRYQQQLDRLSRTRPLNAQVTVAYNPARHQIRIKLPSEHAQRPTSGRIHFYRPSDASLDRDFELAVNADGVQDVDTKKLRAGLWKVRVYWKVNNEEYFFDQSVVVGHS